MAYTANEYKKMIDAALRECFVPGGYPMDGLLEAMSYSLTAEGKRIRPMLVLEFCRVCGGDVEKALPVACAIEMVHAYSLIHDDLPAMDNDDLRRGKPTNHVVFGEDNAILAGDALQAEAFGSILRSDLPAERKCLAAEILAGAAGVDGICGGQYLDLKNENRPDISEEELGEIHSRKTGAMLVAACQMGVAAAGGSDAQLEAAGIFGAAIGAAFQIRDDVLDAVSTVEELGKPIGSDVQQGKTTYYTLFGEEECMRKIKKITEYAKENLSMFEDTAFLCDIADKLAARRN